MPPPKWRIAGNDDGIITAAQGNIDTPTDGFAGNTRLIRTTKKIA
jgi:hypothetical protein